MRAASTVTLATGERHYTRWAFWNLLRERLVDVVQPDLCHCGGIWEARKIAAMAEACDVMVAPHNPNGPVGTAAVVHMAACTPNFLITEYVHTRVDFANTLVQEPLKMVNGYIELPTAPGLGVELNEEAILASPADYKELWSPSRLVI